MKNIKKCPFCGSEVELVDIGEGNGDSYYMMQCLNPDCNASACFGERPNKDDFVHAWNTRLPELGSKEVTCDCSWGNPSDIFSDEKNKDISFRVDAETRSVSLEGSWEACINGTLDSSIKCATRMRPERIIINFSKQ